MARSISQNPGFWCYMARQISEIQRGTRDGAMTNLMKPVVQNLTEAEVVDLVAYTAALAP